jgi:hypothetical protein
MECSECDLLITQRTITTLFDNGVYADCVILEVYRCRVCGRSKQKMFKAVKYGQEPIC